MPRRGAAPLLACLAFLSAFPLLGGETPPKPEEQALLALYHDLLHGKAKPEDAERRHAALETLKSAGAPSQAFLDHLKEQVRTSLKEAEKAAKPEAVTRLYTQRKEAIAKARAAALAIILDETQYPDENHGRQAQPLVDQAVESLRALALPGSRTVAEADTAAREMAEALQALGTEAPPLPDGKALARKMDTLFLEAMSPADDLKTLATNQSALAKADPEVASCFQATCRYRMLMGLPPLAVDPRLMTAAQLHAEDMAKLDYTDHYSKDGKGPDARVRAQGFPYLPVGENIHFGPEEKGEEILIAWQHSSGHHRTLLGKKFQLLGIGHSKDKWVQDFGGGPQKPQRR